MKRSNRGRTSAFRKEIVAAVLVIIALSGVYYYYVHTNANSAGDAAGITSVTTTGISCNASSLPAVATQIEQASAFTKLAGGLCYNYLGQNGTTLSGDPLYFFGRYNGTIIYPCGTTAWQVPQSVIQATDTSGAVANVMLMSSSAIFEQFGPNENCTTTPAVEVVAVTDESNTSSIPQLNLTINAPIQPWHVTALTAILTLNGGKQTFGYVDLSPANTLPQSINVAGVEPLSTGLSFEADEVYPLQIVGTLNNGQSFNYVVQVQIANAPSGG